MDKTESALQFTRRMAEDGLQGNLYGLKVSIESRDTSLRADERQKAAGDGNFSDGYHSFNELYEYRMLYNAALFNEWGRHGKYQVQKSKRHSNGEECFGGGWFIVVAVLPTGQITNHYKIEYWDLFKIPEVKRVTIKYDGHTPQDVATRLRAAIMAEPEEKSECKQ